MPGVRPGFSRSLVRPGVNDESFSHESDRLNAAAADKTCPPDVGVRS